MKAHRTIKPGGTQKGRSSKNERRNSGAGRPLNEMGKTGKKIWNIVTSVIVALVILLAIALVGVRLVGLQVFAVLSGSMEPTYHTGSLIYVKAVDYRDLEAGDVITFMLDEDTVATHRIVEVVADETDPAVLRFRTKGDANDAVDGGLVHFKNVIGSPVFTIPGLGYAANYIQNPPGTYIAISAGAILILLVFLPDLFGKEEEGETEAPERTKRRRGGRPKTRADAERIAARRAATEAARQAALAAQREAHPEEDEPGANHTV